MAWYDKNRGIDFSNPKRQGRFKRIKLNSNALISQYLQGTSEKDMSAIFKVSIPTLRRHFKFLIPDTLRRNKGATANPHTEINTIIRELYKFGFSLPAMEEILNKNDEFIRRRLIKMGIIRRTRAEKNILLYHPKSFNRTKKQYKIQSVKEFNREFLYLYCMLNTPTQISRKLGIDRGTVNRRIKAFRKLYNFKIRQCKICNCLFKATYAASQCHDCNPKTGLKFKSNLTFGENHAVLPAQVSKITEKQFNFSTLHTKLSTVYIKK